MHVNVYAISIHIRYSDILILVLSQVVFLHHIVSGCNLEEEAIKGLMYNDLDKSRFELHPPQQKRTVECVHNHHT